MSPNIILTFFSNEPLYVLRHTDVINEHRNTTVNLSPTNISAYVNFTVRTSYTNVQFLTKQ